MSAETDAESRHTLGTGYLALPDEQTGPGVLVLHPWWGVNEFVRETTDRFAADGFVAFAPDLFHGETATTIDGAERLLEELDPTETQHRLLETSRDFLDHSAVQSKSVGVVGFSMGAAWALRLIDLSPEDIGAVVVYYGTGDGDFTSARTPVLGHFAEIDSFEPETEREALATTLRDAGHDVDFHVYPETGHWFAEPAPADAYAPEAAERAWERTIAFLQTHLS